MTAPNPLGLPSPLLDGVAVEAPPKPTDEQVAAYLAAQREREAQQPVAPLPTADPFSTGAQLVAPDVTITLLHGKRVQVRYGMRGLHELEQAFGSLRGVATVLGGAGDETGAVFGPTVRLLACGLTHEGFTFDTLLDALDPARLGEYAEAAGTAFRLAFPQAAAGNAGTPAATPTPPAPGASGTTSAP